MRIRKNAKTSSAFLHISSNFPASPTSMCLLNQSPWDIITFPSTHSSSSTSIHLFDDFVTCYNVNVAANWSSPDSGRSAFQSVDSTMNSFDSEYDAVNGNGNVDDKIRDYELYQKEDKLGFTKGCVKKEDNFVDLQNDAVWTTHKKAQPVVSKTRGNKKRAVTITSKQNEFYYYSGFGPSWGKKRGELGNKCTSFNAYDTTSSNTSVHEANGDVSDMDVEEDQKRAEPDATTMRTVWSCLVAPVTEDFDDVDDDEQKEKTVKRRGRKPMKARSLKSLM